MGVCSDGYSVDPPSSLEEPLLGAASSSLWLPVPIKTVACRFLGGTSCAGSSELVESEPPGSASRSHSATLFLELRGPFRVPPVRPYLYSISGPENSEVQVVFARGNFLRLLCGYEQDKKAGRARDMLFYSLCTLNSAVGVG